MAMLPPTLAARFYVLAQPLVAGDVTKHTDSYFQPLEYGRVVKGRVAAEVQTASTAISHADSVRTPSSTISSDDMSSQRASRGLNRHLLSPIFPLKNNRMQ